MRSVQVYENGTLGESWKTEVTRILPFVGIPMYNIVPTRKHIVTVVLGDDQVFRDHIAGLREKLLKPKIGRWGQLQEWEDDLLSSLRGLLSG